MIIKVRSIHKRTGVFGCFSSVALLILLTIFLIFNNSFSYFFPIATACPQTSSSHSDNNSTATTSPANFLSYENSTLGIKIKYPADWAHAVFPNFVSFNPTFKGEPIFTIYLDIYVNSFGNNHTRTYYENNTLSKGTKFVLTPIIVAGYPAIKNVFTDLRGYRGPCAPPFPERVNLTDIYILKGEKVYSIEYQTSNTGPYLLATIQKMINSFQIIDNATADQSKQLRPATVTGANLTSAAADIPSIKGGDLFSFNYTKVQQYSSGPAHYYKILYDPVKRELTTLSDSVGGGYHVPLSVPDESKLKNMIIKNVATKNVTHLGTPVANSSTYTLTITINGHTHTVQWSNSIPFQARENLSIISNAIIDTFCQSANENHVQPNPVACTNVLDEYR